MEIDVWAGARATSYLANGVLLALWVKKKSLLNEYLEGRWEGTLRDIHDPNFMIDCELSVSRHRDRCKGLLIYYTKIAGNLAAKGVDSIVEYDNRELLGSQWNPVFRREVHVVLDTNTTSNDPETYQFDFCIEKRWFKDRMRVATSNKAGRALAGLWHKQ